MFFSVFPSDLYFIPTSLMIQKSIIHMTGASTIPFLGAGVRFKNIFESTYVDNLLWFWKYSPIFSFSIGPNLDFAILMKIKLSAFDFDFD